MVHKHDQTNGGSGQEVTVASRGYLHVGLGRRNKHAGVIDHVMSGARVEYNCFALGFGE